MSYREHKAADISDAIRQVLVRDWDPIGVMDDHDWPRDEYDSYIGEIYRYLARGEPVEFIARHLCVIEEKLMGLGRIPESYRLQVAIKLKAINVALSQQE
jgi:hypothetical protein